MSDGGSPELDHQRKGGRPRVPERGVVVSVYLPRGDRKRLIAIADRHDMKVSAILRHLIEVCLPPQS